MNTAQRARCGDGTWWNVFNLDAARGGRYGKKRYPTAGAAVAHRLGVSGRKGERFALALNEALRAFMIEATEEREER
jgi:hypothetical protein